MAASYQSAQIPVVPFGFEGYSSGFMLVFAANDDVWQHVQCMSTTDSFTSSRVCCSCGDPSWCPFGNFPRNDWVYCDYNACTSENCKQLAAGCGVSLYDVSGQANGGDGNSRVGNPKRTDWGGEACDAQRVQSGQCNMCRQPLWCNDDNAAWAWGAGRIDSASKWMEEFFDADGGHALGARQCKWRRSEKQTFIESIRMRYEQRPQLWASDDHANDWNEVSFYVDPEGGLARTMWDNLLGLVYVESAGNDYELQKLRELAAHWRQLGFDVPTFAMSAVVEHWRADQSVDVLAPPYSLRVLD